jgi:hypothetical protein
VWALAPVWTFGRREKPLAPNRIRTPDHPDCSLLTTDYTIFQSKNIITIKFRNNSPSLNKWFPRKECDFTNVTLSD